MADAYENDEPYCMRYAQEVFDQMTGLRVDMSWLREYDIDKIDVAESFVSYHTRTREEKREESPWASPEDLELAASSMGKAVGWLFSLLRLMKTVEDEEGFPLLLALQTVAMAGYERGVRDAISGELSAPTIRNIVSDLAQKDDLDRAMHELYEDIR